MKPRPQPSLYLRAVLPTGTHPVLWWTEQGWTSDTHPPLEIYGDMETALRYAGREADEFDASTRIEVVNGDTRPPVILAAVQGTKPDPIT